MSVQRINPSELAEPVGYEPGMAEALFAGVGEVFGDAMPTAATTLHGVQSLFEPDHLVEIDVIAER